MQKLTNAFCSICTLNYSAYAATLNDSLKNAGHIEPHYVLIVDPQKKYNQLLKKFSFIPVMVEQLKIPNFRNLTVKYTAFELSNVLKPYFIKWLLINHPEIRFLIYLDSDMYAYTSLNYIFTTLQQNKNTSVYVNPHVVDEKSFDRKDDYQDERNYFLYGIYNGGLYAFKNNNDSINFTTWHQKILRNHGFNAPQAQMFVDQKVLDFAPALFCYVGIFKHQGYNISHWNLSKKCLVRKNGIIHHHNQKLALFHFSHLEINYKKPYMSNFCNVRFKQHPVLRTMVTSYIKHLQRNSHQYFSSINYKYLPRYLPQPLAIIDPGKFKEDSLNKHIAQLKLSENSLLNEISILKTKIDQIISPKIQQHHSILNAIFKKYQKP